MGVMMNFAPVEFEQTIDEAFPDVNPGINPFGSRVLVQILTAKSKSKGGIALARETREAVQWNQQTGVIRALGPLAFRDRKTRELWPEGAWADVGKFVRVPKYGGDKWERPIPNTEDQALFVIFNDLDLLGEVTCDPREIIAFV